MSTDAPVSILDIHKELLEAFAERQLRPYIDYVKTRPRQSAPKVFNDPIWKSIILYPLEIALLDSPLLQRLRRVRHLGVAHWIYPGATHSRLEHSIGTVHQIQQLISAINTLDTFIDTAETHLLRLAALCHDIGHGVMSHVSENAFKDVEGCQSIRLAFADHFELEDIQLNEVSGYYLIGSPSFKELLEIIMALYREHPLPSNPAE
jgi:HD superfamily phosphohydrolase